MLWCTTEGEGDFFDAASLQCAPGVNIQSLLAVGSTAAGEHVGEEYEDDDDEGEEEGQDYAESAATADAHLAVTGHAIRSSGRVEGTGGAANTEPMDDTDAVIAEHHEGEVLFKR